MRELTKQRVAAVCRISFGLLGLVALAVQFATGWARPGFSVVNFFSYFTTLSNMLGAIVFLWIGFGTRRTPGAELMRGAVTLSLSLVFPVYVILLSDIPLGILRPWVNIVLHYVMPLAVLLDWVCAPPKHKLDLRWSLTWLAFPLLFVTYSLIRGAATNWYPYPFLDPSKAGGYEGVAKYCIAITAVFVAFAVLLTWLGNRLRDKPMAFARGDEA